MKSERNSYQATPFFLITVIGLISAICLVDSFVPQGFAIQSLYIFPLLLTVRSARTSIVWATFGLCAGLTIIGFIISPGGLYLEGLTNRAISLFLMILCTWLILRIRAVRLAIVQALADRTRAENDLQDLNTSLERRVSERTRELVSARNAAINILNDADLARQKAEQAEVRLRMVLESAPCGILATDRHGTITMVNGRIERLFGYSRGELLGQPVEMLLPNGVREKHCAHRKGYLSAPSSRDMGAGRDLPGQRKDGSQFLVEIGLNPVESPNGLEILASVVDISERTRLANQSLARQAEELRRSNSDLQQFAYVASHDLQEPLRMVSSYCGMLKRRYAEKLDDNAREFIEFAVDGANRMKLLLEDLLAYSRVGQQAKSLAPTEMGRVLTKALENLKITIDETKASITHDPLPPVLGDPVQLTLVFQNLLGNALKFREQGIPTIHVSAFEAEAGQQNHHWVFSVRDNGIGFDPALADRIFTIFQRLHTRDQYAGSGMGLAICKKIVERHGGKIWAEATPGAGSTFFFTLPAASLTQAVDRGLTPFLKSPRAA